VLTIVGNLTDSVINGNVQYVRRFLAAETNFSTAVPVPSVEYQHNNMTLVMLAARYGELFSKLFLLCCDLISYRYYWYCCCHYVLFIAV